MRAICACWLAVLAVTAATAQAAGPSLTPAEYRAKASAICKNLSRKPEPTGTLVQRMIILFQEGRAAMNSIMALRPPASLAPLHAQLKTVLTAEFRDISSVIARLKAGRMTNAQLSAWFSNDKLSNQEEQLWKKLGVPACENL